MWNSNLPGGGCGNSDYWVRINSTPVIDLVNHVMYVIVYTQIGIFPLSSAKQTQLPKSRTRAARASRGLLSP